MTNDRIVLLNEEDNDAAAKKISTLDRPPEFEPNDIYGITTGSFEHQEGGVENDNQIESRPLHL